MSTFRIGDTVCAVLTIRSANGDRLEPGDSARVERASADGRIVDVRWGGAWRDRRDRRSAGFLCDCFAEWFEATKSVTPPRCISPNRGHDAGREE